VKEVATNLVLDALRTGALTFSSASPLQQMNQRLAQSWTVNVEDDNAQEALSSDAQVVVTSSRSTLGAEFAFAFSSAGMAAMNSPQTTSQLLEMAMNVTQQGQQTAVSDTESITSWVNRAVPTATPAQTSAVPQEAQPTTPASNPQNGAAPVEAPQVRPAVETPTAPGETAPATPEAPTEAPGVSLTSDVRWLMPPSDLTSWPASTPTPPSQTDLLSSLSTELMGAVAKLGQWVGWGSSSSNEGGDEG